MYAHYVYDFKRFVHLCIAFNCIISHAGIGHVTVTAHSAHSIILSHNLTESGVNYLCNVAEVESGEKRAVNKKVFTRLTSVTRLLPDTTYRVDCVAYHSDGVEYCLEANTTVTTRELVHSVKVTVRTYICK